MGIYDREYYRDDENPGAAGLLPGTLVVRLIVINSLVFATNLFFGGDTDWVMRKLALTPTALVAPWRWWQFITYAFAHNPDNIMHLLCNMLGLWCFGREMENRYGPRELLRFYLLAALLGGLVWGCRNYAMGIQQATLMGASGAVTAVVILFVCCYPHQQVLVMMVIPLPAWALGILMIGLDILNAGNPASRIAFDVHLTGAAFAFLYFHQGWNLGRWLPDLAAWRRRRAVAKSDLRIHQVDDDELEESYRGRDEEADRILDKLHRDGELSLTPDERRTLEAYSRRMRQKHR